jgi:hypothetical protein
MKRWGLVAAPTAAVFVALLTLSSVAAATGVHPGQTIETAKCTVNHGAETLVFRAPPSSAKATLVVDLKWTVHNDEDSGYVGYWALDDYSNTLYVWNVSGTYYFIQSFQGTFHSPKGALSPGNGVEELANVQGSFNGAVYGALSGAVLSMSVERSGYLGTDNYGGSNADILKGTYGAGQTGPAISGYWWVTELFGSGASVSSSPSAWGFVYHTNNPDNTATQWCNMYNEGAPGASIGDVIAS